MRIKILDLNIWLGGLYFDKIIEFLKTQDADILTFQEVHNSDDPILPKNFRSVEEIQKNLDYEYVYFDPSFIKVFKGLKAVEGNAVFSRFPITETESYHLGGTWGEYDEKDRHFELLPREIQRAEIDLGGKIINVFNTQGVWGKDGEDNQDRLNMANQISDFIGNRQNVILTGDFNVKPHTKTIAILEKKLTSVFKNELATTFNMKRKKDPGYADAVVDMIFVSPGIEIIEHECPNVDISDHLPLVVLLEV